MPGPLHEAFSAVNYSFFPKSSILVRMTEMLWVGLPILVAVGSGILAYFVMKARMEAAIAGERATLAEARARLEAQAKTMEETIRATEEAARRKALDEFLADLRVEERHYTREQKALFLSKKSLVLQERIFFRNIPLSSWVEHEMPIEEGADVEKLAKTLAVFAPDLMMLAPGGSQKRPSPPENLFNAAKKLLG
jgi:hypothetical protein